MIVVLGFYNNPDADILSDSINLSIWYLFSVSTSYHTCIPQLPSKSRTWLNYFREICAFLDCNSILYG